MNKTTPTALYVLAGVMFVALLAAMVTLAIAGQETATIERIFGPLLGTVFTVGVFGVVSHSQNQRLTEQDSKLDKITAQTNGVLDERIERKTLDAVRTWADEVGLVVPAAVADDAPADLYVPDESDPDLYVPAHAQ